MRALDRFRRWLRRGRRGRGGFTLVEVLVVMVIMAIGILPLALIQTRARAEVQESDSYTRAVTVAQHQLEWAKGRGFAAAAPDSGYQDGVAWRTALTDVDMGLRRVDVIVVFNQGGTPDTLQMTSLLSMR
jgi:prepilin-type N-terminal cleavage/methylation domain-containing protein